MYGVIFTLPLKRFSLYAIFSGSSYFKSLSISSVVGIEVFIYYDCTSTIFSSSLGLGAEKKAEKPS
jgi:hypothetical protein